MTVHPLRLQPACPGRLSARRRGLLLTCALGTALALAGRAEPVRAQATTFTPSTAAGSVTYSRNSAPTPGSETVTVISPTAIVDWSAPDTAVPAGGWEFLPAGNTLTFQNGTNPVSGILNPDFAILNRMFGTQGAPIRFDGTVISQLQDASGSLSRGGTVLFSNPGGIIVGGGAVFDVGNLVLTSLDLVGPGNDDGYGNLIDFTPGEYQFLSGSPDAGIQIEAGAQINAGVGGDGYVALIAPSIDNAGTIRVDGSAALIAGEEVNLRVNEGLFDISVPVGTQVATPLTNTGSITGTASTGPTDPRALYFVAVGRDDPIQLLLQGNVGFDAPVGATIENGEIVISAGYNVVGGAIEESPVVQVIDGVFVAPVDSDISITGGNFTSDVTARATNDFTANSENSDLSFSGDLTATAAAALTLGATSGQLTNVDGNVSLTSLGYYGTSETQILAASSGRVTIGGDVSLTSLRPSGYSYANYAYSRISASEGGGIVITGNATLDASDTRSFGNGVGGTAGVYANAGGSVQIGGDLSLLASGTGGVGEGGGANGFGGDATIQGSGGSVSVGGNLLMDVNGTAAYSYGGFNEPITGSTGAGGSFRIGAYGGGSVAVSGTSDIRARGLGGDVNYGSYSSAGNIGGSGFGGSGDITAEGGTVTLTGSQTVDVSGVGGDGQVGGEGAGGSIFIAAFDDESSNQGVATLGGDLSVDASGRGGIGGTDVGGIGTGGRIELRGSDGGALAFGGTTGTATLRADGIGGQGATDGGDGIGGFTDSQAEESGGVFISGDGGTVAGANIVASATGTGGYGVSGAGGTGTGGLLSAFAANGGALSFVNASLDAGATGGDGATGGAGNAGFTADSTQGLETGAFISAQDGTLTGTSATVSAVGTGGDGLTGAGGAGTGGTAQISALNGTTPGLIQLVNATVDVSATGGDGASGLSGGDGGTATAGSTGLAIAQTLNGTLRITGTTTLKADATGGNGGDGADGNGGRGGDALGGFIQIGGVSGIGTGTPAGGATFGTVNGSASALGGAGGNGATSGNGGNGLAGALSLLARGGTLTAGDVTFAVNGTGGSAVNGATGGIGSGGQISALFTPRFQTTDPATVNVASLTGTASGTGGAGSIPGQSRFGVFQVQVDGSNATIGTVSLTAAGENPLDTTQANLIDGVGDVSQFTVNNGTLNMAGDFGLTTPGLFAATFTNGNAQIGGMIVRAAGVTFDATGSSFTATGDSEFDVSYSSGGLSDATGGSFALAANDSSVAFDGDLAVYSVGSAGSGGSLAYSGTGGAVTITSTNNSSVSTGGTFIDARGLGGAADGSFPESGDGGSGTGGTVTATADSGSAISFGAGSINASGAGGILQGGTTGAGGTGRGGAITFTANAGGTVGSSGALTLSTTGTGGAGPTGGDGQGGLIAIRASGGSLAFADLTALNLGIGGFANTTTGGTGGGGIGGSIELTTELGYGASGTPTAQFGALALSATGIGGAGDPQGTGVGIGGDGSGGGIVIAASSVSMTFGNATIGADGQGGAGATAGGGSGGSILLSADGTGTVTGGDFVGSAVGFNSDQSPGTGGNWRISADGSTIRLASAQLNDGGGAEGPSTITLDDGTFTVDGDGLFFAGAIDVNAAGDSSVTGGNVTLLAGDVTLNHSDRPAGTATIDVNNFAASADNAVVVNDGVLARAGNSLGLEAGGTVTIAGRVAAPLVSIGSSDIDIANTGFIGDATTQSVTLEVRPAPGADFAGQTVIGGDEEGPAYTLTNGEAAKISTSLLRISVPVTGTDPGRDADVVVRDLTLSATPNPGGVAVNSFELDVGGGVESSEGQVVPAALQPGQGIARIEGNLLLAGGGDTSQILVNASGRIEVVTPDGSIRLRDGAGNPAGSVLLVSDNIWAASADLLDQLRTDPAFAGRNDALLANDGSLDPKGYIEGGDVSLFVGQSLLVQNSGGTDGFGGITVSGDLTVTPNGSDPLDVFAFGRRVESDGSFVTDSAFFREVTFEQGYGGFATAAEFNQCAIATGVCPDDVPPPPPPPSQPDIQPPTQDQVQQPVEDGTDESESQPVVNVNEEFDDNSIFSSESLIEEPVTSGGDSSQWSEPDNCDPATDGDCQPAGGAPGTGGTGGRP